MQDMENTTGSWDLYGQDEKKRYPDLQAKFFTQSADILGRSDALRAFVALSESSEALAANSSKGSMHVPLVHEHPSMSGLHRHASDSCRLKLSACEFHPK